MAKKKVAVNKLSWLWDLLTLLLGGLLLGFVALPHIKGEVSSSIIGASGSTMTSGYSLINFDEGANVGVAVVLLLLVIFASLMVLCAVVSLLCDFKIIKNAMLIKVSKWMMLVLAGCITILAIVNMITVSNACSSAGGELIKAGTYAIWGTLVVNAIISLASVFTSALSLKK